MTPQLGSVAETRARSAIEFRHGLVTSIRHYFDMMTMMQQLGALGGV